MIRSMDVGKVGASVPGSALHMLPAGVALLSPEESVWQGMLRGWRTQQLARQLRETTVSVRVRVVERFQEFTGTYPWTWSSEDLESWFVVLRTTGVSGQGRAFGTLRSYQAYVAGFCGYLVSPAYGWAETCLERFGEHPVQICHEGNRIRHVLESETDPRVRPFTRPELQLFFDFADDQVERAARSRRKGWLTTFRDATIFKFVYAYGLRRTESLKVDTVDFHRNPATPEFGEYGSCSVRYGKSSKGGPPKRRTVLTVFPWAVEVLAEYQSEVRPLFEPDGVMLFPTERGGRVCGAYLDARFSEYRDAAGLPEDLHLHCLRHSYVTHLVEDGFDPFFVQQQVGHAYSSTTALYTGVSNDFKNHTLRRALDRCLDPAVTAPGREPRDVHLEGAQA